MNLTETDYGSFVSQDDPGEPIVNAKRISVTKDEAALLGILGRGRAVLEIGTGLGVSTRALEARATSLTTCDIDPWVQANVWPDLPRGVKTVERPTVTQTYDLVFIDGAHDTGNTMADITEAMRRIERGGMIIVHDTKMPDVRDAIETLWSHPTYIDTHHGMGYMIFGERP